jgi:hypothetical protein
MAECMGIEPIQSAILPASMLGAKKTSHYFAIEDGIPIPDEGAAR